MTPGIAIDTNVLVRWLVRDDDAQYSAARTLIDQAEASEAPVLILLGVIIETEWVLRSRYKLGKAAIIDAFTCLLESVGVVHEDEQALEEALSLWKKHLKADFTDCMLVARASQLGTSRFVTFDVDAARLPRAELLAAVH